MVATSVMSVVILILLLNNKAEEDESLDEDDVANVEVQEEGVKVAVVVVRDLLGEEESEEAKGKDEDTDPENDPEIDECSSHGSNC